MAHKLNLGSDFLAVKHRLLNTYVHNYKDKLCLTSEDDMISKKGGFSLTIDFNELALLKQATEEAGYDPYTFFIKMRKDQRKAKQQEVFSHFTKAKSNSLQPHSLALSVPEPEASHG